MDLELLDRRSFQHAIEKEMERIKSRPVDLAIVESGKSIIEAQIRDLVRLREVATPDEAIELDVELARLSVRLGAINAELSARSHEQESESEPLASGEVARGEPNASRPQGEAVNYVLLLNQVLEKRREPGESKTAVLRDWLEEHRHLSRTAVTDYRGGRTQGRVSKAKCEAIEVAVRTSARKLGFKVPPFSD